MSSEMGKGRVVSLVGLSLLPSRPTVNSHLAVAPAQSTILRSATTALRFGRPGLRMGSAERRRLRAAARPLENTEEAADAARRCALARSVSILAK